MMTSSAPAGRTAAAHDSSTPLGHEHVALLATVDEALRSDYLSRLRHAISSHLDTRLLAGVVLGIFGVLTPGPRELALAGGVVALLYMATVALLARAAGSAREVERLATALVVADALGLGATALLGALPGLQRAVVVGIVLVGVSAFSFGPRKGVLAAIVGGVLYVTGTATWWALEGMAELPWLAATIDLLAFAGGSYVTVRVFGGFRRRLDALREFGKHEELGDFNLPLPAELARGADDLSLLGRSLDAMRNRLADEVGTDPLTNCANRRALEKRLVTEWRMARRRQSFVAVAAIDVDFFKQINDTRGHPFGDMVLQQLASIMLTTARDSDTVARLGGDEFVVVLPDTDSTGVTQFGERLRAAVMGTTFGSPSAPLRITVSVGVAVGNGSSEEEAESLLREADRSLYRAKIGGRNRVAA